MRHIERRTLPLLRKSPGARHGLTPVNLEFKRQRQEDYWKFMYDC